MDSKSLPSCPACSSRLKAPGICSKCGPLKFYVVKQPRVRRVVYSREVWAPNEESAIRLVAAGTAWPEEYDERTLEYTEGEYSATEESDEGQVKYRRRYVGFPDE